MTPENLKPKFGNVQMKPISPNQILRNLEHGYFMTHQEQSEAAQYIRQLQQAVLDEREAIAALVEADGRVHEKAPDFVWRQTIAKLIRARGVTMNKRIKPEPEPIKWSTLCSALVAIREYRFMPTPENQVDAENKFQEALRVIGESE